MRLLVDLPGEGDGTALQFAWKIPWMGEPGGLQSMGSRRVGHDWATSLSFFTFMHWTRKWQPTPVFLPGESQGEPGGLPSMGSHQVGHDWSNLAAAAEHTISPWTDTQNVRETKMCLLTAKWEGPLLRALRGVGVVKEGFLEKGRLSHS